MRDLRAIFEPKSIAIIGATSNPQSITNLTFLKQLTDFGYPGPIYPVNPNADQVMGLKAYASIRDIPEPVDYVICAVAAAAAPKVMLECVAAKVKVVSLFTSGFSEVGQDGANLEREVVEIAREGGVLVLGPNCLGAHCPKAGLTLLGNIGRSSGHVGFVSQSGALAQEIIQALSDREIYMSKAISLGNAADLNESDYLEYLGADEETQTVGAYVEGIKEPDRFLSVARGVVRKKPLIVLKGGRTSGGAAAARLHTGSLAGSSVVWEALCRQAGIVQVNGRREMIDTIQAFTYLKPPKGRRVGIISVGGGFCVLAADECISAGLVVPELPEEVKSQLRKFNPLAGTSLRNPVDTPAPTFMSPDALCATVRAVAGWSGIDTVLVAFPVLFGLWAGLQYLLDGFRAVIETAREMDKPVAIVLSTDNSAEGETKAWELQKHCFRLGAPVYFTFDQAARAVSHLVSYHERVISEVSY
jgi:acyl-CoA synthetase (NDP forming)